MDVARLLFGNPPFRFLANNLAGDERFLEDAQQVLQLDQGAYSRLTTQLAKTDAFLNRSDLGSIVDETLGKNEDSDRIASIIFRVGEIVHAADMDAMDAMDALGTAIEEKAESLEPQDRRTLVDRLRKLAVEPVGIAKQHKARKLVDATGAELDDFRIICDIRPIFDQNRKQIDGAIPITVLRLEYSKPDGESAVVEMRVTEKQIEKFGERIADAGCKLNMIKELLASQNLPIPKTKSTGSEVEA